MGTRSSRAVRGIAAKHERGPLNECRPRRGRSETGVALVLVVLAVLLMSAIAAALSISTATDRLIAGSFRTSEEGVYAADAGLERAASDVRQVAEWSTVVSGEIVSGFTDGAPSGVRVMPDGRLIDPALLASAAGPGWVPFAFGRIGDLVPDGPRSPPFYVVVLAARTRPDRDDWIELRAQAFGPRGARQQVEATLAKTDEPPGSRVLSWRLVR